jgi:uncharacterized protein
MKKEKLTIDVSKSIGSVSGELYEVQDSKFVMVLAHGAGAGMDHPFMTRLSEELATYKINTLRFNFSYMEKGSKRPDPAPMAEKTVEAVLQKAHERFPTLSIIASGKSFGGRMSSQLLCKHTLPYVKAIVFYGFPLHAVGNPGVERAKHLNDITLPMLFIQGTRDALARLDLMEEVTNDLSSSTLVKIEGADHSFKVGKKDSIVDLSRITHDWLLAQNIH